MKTYRNSERTKKWIRHAFTELLAEKKSINEITINELAARADITKTTFYYHYEDIYAVAEEFENELIEQLNLTLDQIADANAEDYTQYLNKVLAFIKDNEESYKMAANASELSFFATKLKTVFSKKITSEKIPQGFSPDYEKRAVQVYFLVSACVDTIMQYLKGGLPADLDTVGEVLTDAVEKLRRE